MTEFWRSALLPQLEVRRSAQENLCYRPHAHDAFSIGLIEAGASVLSGPLEGAIRLLAGDVVLIPSGQVHACNPDQGRWQYQMIHADQQWAATLTPAGGASKLFAGITVFRDPDLRSRIAELNATLFADQSRERTEAAFAALFRDLENSAPVHRVTDLVPVELLAQLAPVLHRLRHDGTTPSLNELAELIGMTKYQLVRAMRRATGLSPMAWRQNARIVEARQLLRQGHPIAETAHSLGFTDQSHFHRVFRAHVAASPGTYRA